MNKKSPKSAKPAPSRAKRGRPEQTLKLTGPWGDRVRDSFAAPPKPKKR